MMEMTPDAERRFEQYMTRVRATLRGTPTAADVEQSVREHVEIALAGMPGPVGVDNLGSVLDQLGAPERWVPEEERPAWRRVLDRITHGPEDWRLAYASFALTLLMVLFFSVGGILLVAPAYLLSRALVEHLADRGEPLGARRWLIAPPIAILLAIVTLTALIAPIIPAGAFGIGEGGIYTALGLEKAELSRAERMRIETGFLSLAAGTSWLILSGLYALAYRPYRWLFLPLTERLRRGHALVLALVGTVFVALGAVLMFVV